MEGFWDLPKEQAIKAYGEANEPTLAEQLLYAILAQVDKANHQLGLLVEGKTTEGT